MIRTTILCSVALALSACAHEAKLALATGDTQVYPASSGALATARWNCSASGKVVHIVSVDPEHDRMTFYCAAHP